MGKGFRCEVAIGLIVLAIFILGAIFFSDAPLPSPIQSMRTWQEADAPPGFPIGIDERNPDGRIPEFSGDFVLLDGFERFVVPPVSRLDWPRGTERGALIRETEQLPAGEPQTGERPAGIELAALGAADSGGAVHAVGNGVVVFAADRGDELGRLVILAHRAADGGIIHSASGRLQTIDVALGALVARGQTIGTAGASSGGSLPLHFAFYDGASIDPAQGDGAGAAHRHDPAAMLASHRPAADDLAPEPLAVYQSEAEARHFRIGPGGTPVPAEE